LGLQFFSAGVIEDGEFQDLSTQVVVARHVDTNIAIVAFRGTQEFLDVIADLRGIQNAFKYGGANWGLVHRGFQNAYVPVAEMVREPGTLPVNAQFSYILPVTIVVPGK
jgi:hypothetical protein